ARVGSISQTAALVARHGGPSECRAHLAVDHVRDQAFEGVASVGGGTRLRSLLVHDSELRCPLCGSYASRRSAASRSGTNANDEPRLLSIMKASKLSLTTLGDGPITTSPSR